MAGHVFVQLNGGSVFALQIAHALKKTMGVYEFAYMFVYGMCHNTYVYIHIYIYIPFDAGL